MGRSGPQQIPGCRKQRRTQAGGWSWGRFISAGTFPYTALSSKRISCARVPVRTFPSRVYSRKLEHTA